MRRSDREQNERRAVAIQRVGWEWLRSLPENEVVRGRVTLEFGCGAFVSAEIKFEYCDGFRDAEVTETRANLFALMRAPRVRRFIRSIGTQDVPAPARRGKKT